MWKKIRGAIMQMAAPIQEGVFWTSSGRHVSLSLFPMAIPFKYFHSRGQHHTQRNAWLLHQFSRSRLAAHRVNKLRLARATGAMISTNPNNARITREISQKWPYICCLFDPSKMGGTLNDDPTTYVKIDTTKPCDTPRYMANDSIYIRFG